REQTMVGAPWIREERCVVIAEQRDDPATCRARLRAQLVESEDHADAVTSAVDVIADGDEKLPSLRRVPDDVASAVARGETRGNEQLVELLQPAVHVAHRPERVEIGEELLGGDRDPGSRWRDGSGRFPARGGR